MALFVFLVILPLLLLFMYHKSKQSHTQHSSSYLSLFRTHNLPEPYSLTNLSRTPSEDRLSYISSMIAASQSSTLTVHFPLATGSYIFTANPNNVRHILKTRFSTYIKGQTHFSIFGELFGRGMFNVDGDEWKFLHQIVSQEFTKGPVRRMLETVVEPCVSDSLVPTLLIAAKNGQVLDLEDVFQRFNLDTTCKILFGYDPKCLSRSLEGSEFLMAFREGILMAVQRSKLVFSTVLVRQIEKFFNVGFQKQLMEMAGKMREFALSIVEHKREKLKLGLEVEDFLSRLLQNNNDENMIIDFILSSILAGHDTISSALTWFFWVVATNPKVEDEILREIRRVKEWNPAGLMYDQVKDMEYMHAALCESMRLYPPVPLEMKEVAKDDVLPDGTQVSKGMRVICSIYSMGRSERIWGKDWAEYKPERWLERVDESSKKWRFIPRDPYTYPVFNAGPRSCLGKELAFLQMKTFVFHVLNKFKVVPRNAAIGGLEPKYFYDITSKMKGGFPVSLEERKRI